MTPPAAAAEHYRAQQRLAVVVMAAARAQWARMTLDFDASWALVLPGLLRLLTAAQLAAARQGAEYVPTVLDEQGTPADALAVVRPEAFAGVASDGRPLDTLLFGAVALAKHLAVTSPPELALQRASPWLDRVVRTQVADASRGAAGVAIAARPRVGWVRMLNPPACSRCALLAGREYRWNQGFRRHPACFPAGVVVSGPNSLAATRRWYEGKLIVLRTASGQELPATGNHPVLTDRGWVPANLLQEGDHVVRSTLAEGAVPLVVPDHQQMPARIEDVWRAGAVSSLHSMPTTAEDFHGDGGHGEVDVVLADGFLRDGGETAVCKPLEELLLTGRVTSPSTLATLGSSPQHGLALLDSTNRLVRGSGLGAPLFGSHGGGAHKASLGSTSYGNASRQQSMTDDSSADVVAQAQAVLALAGFIGSGDLLNRQQSLTPRWDAPAGPLSVETGPAYASRGEQLRFRLSGQVALDRVIDARRIKWSNHVYNLTSAEGWYSANGFIVSNCDCRHIPVRENAGDDLTTDPRAYFDSLSAPEQDRIFTKAGAQAIRDGADPGQVVNARRGMDKATGTTAAGRRARGQRRQARLMPERIYEMAGSRDEALRLLRDNGYVL